MSAAHFNPGGESKRSGSEQPSVVNSRAEVSNHAGNFLILAMDCYNKENFSEAVRWLEEIINIHQKIYSDDYALRTIVAEAYCLFGEMYLSGWLSAPSAEIDKEVARQNEKNWLPEARDVIAKRLSEAKAADYLHHAEARGSMIAKCHLDSLASHGASDTSLKVVKSYWDSLENSPSASLAFAYGQMLLRTKALRDGGACLLFAADAGMVEAQHQLGKCGHLSVVERFAWLRSAYEGSVSRPRMRKELHQTMYDMAFKVSSPEFPTLSDYLESFYRKYTFSVAIGCMETLLDMAKKHPEKFAIMFMTERKELREQFLRAVYPEKVSIKEWLKADSFVFVDVTYHFFGLRETRRVSPGPCLVPGVVDLIMEYAALSEGDLLSNLQSKIEKELDKASASSLIFGLTGAEGEKISVLLNRLKKRAQECATWIYEDEVQKGCTTILNSLSFEFYEWHILRSPARKAISQLLQVARKYNIEPLLFSTAMLGTEGAAFLTTNYAVKLNHLISLIENAMHPLVGSKDFLESQRGKKFQKCLAELPNNVFLIARGCPNPYLPSALSEAKTSSVDAQVVVTKLVAQLNAKSSDESFDLVTRASLNWEVVTPLLSHTKVEKSASVKELYELVCFILSSKERAEWMMAPSITGGSGDKLAVHTEDPYGAYVGFCETLLQDVPPDIMACAEKTMAVRVESGAKRRAEEQLDDSCRLAVSGTAALRPAAPGADTQSVKRHRTDAGAAYGAAAPPVATVFSPAPRVERLTSLSAAGAAPSAAAPSGSRG